MSLRGRSPKQSPIAKLETASPLARSDMGNKVNSYYSDKGLLYQIYFCNYSPSWHVIARAQPEAISNSRLETASPPARSDMGNKVNSYERLM